jgi:sortase (surface protein transpeptidase)
VHTPAPTDSDSWFAIESPEFAARFGALLAATRRRATCSVEELAASNAFGFDAAQLRQFECGSATIDESIAETLCLVYAADIGQILPARLPVTIGDLRLSSEGLGVEFSPADPTTVLVAYLRLIRRMRNQKRAPAIALRRDDVDVLASYLDIDGADVVERLSTLMNVTTAQRATMAMLFATGAIVIGLATGSHVAAGATSNVAGASNVATATTATALVGGIDRSATVAGLSSATRLHIPDTTPPLVVSSASPAPNQSGCNPDPSGAVMTMVIADIAYSCPVYPGGQPMIDAGYVTLVTDAGPNAVLATRPGDPGTLWLAGHRTTHGAAFAHVPDLADGALVTVTAHDATATYRIVGRSYVEVRGGRVVDSSGRATATATWASIIRDDFSGNLAPRLVLQTCEGEDFRWMIYADLVTG